MYYVYVLKSIKNNKRYTGFTTKEPKERAYEHNTGSCAWTRRNKPFELVYAESFSDKRIAREREMYFKTGAGRRFLDKVIPL